MMTHYKFALRSALIACSAGAALTLSGGVAAFNLPETVKNSQGEFNDAMRWEEGTVTMSIDIPDVQQPANDRWNRAFAEAVERWNAVTGFELKIIPEESAPCTDDGRNGAGFSDLVCFSDNVLQPFPGNPGDVLAVTVVRPGIKVLEAATANGGNVYNQTSAEIIYNSAVEWGVYSGTVPPSPNVVDFRRVTVHELGHVMGLEHVLSTAVEPAVMEADIGNIEYPQSDDIKGVNARYPMLTNGAAAECSDSRSFGINQSVDDVVVGTCVSADFVAGTGQQPSNRYRLTVGKTDVLEIKVTGVGGFETSIALYASTSGALVASGAAGDTSVLKQEVPAGTYDVVISGVELGVAGTYRTKARLGNASVSLVPILLMLVDEDEAP